MSEELKIIQNEDGTFSEYDDTFDITIHCRSEEEQNEVLAKLNALKALEQEPCDDCISRETTVERLCKIAEIMNKKREGLGSPYVMAALFIQDNKDEFPPVTPQPKIGHWIEKDITYYEELNKRGLGVDEYTPYFTDDIACSECLAKYSMLDNETQFFKFCPNCGAKMV